jgi:hypothetical protein
MQASMRKDNLASAGLGVFFVLAWERRCVGYCILLISYAFAPVVVAFKLAVLKLPGPADPAHPQPVQSDYSRAR